jgi:hypothetical protein
MDGDRNYKWKRQWITGNDHNQGEVNMTAAGGFSTPEVREDFFRETKKALKALLPPILRDFKDASPRMGNYMTFRYPGLFPNGSYELQFAKSRAKQHARVFGPGDKTILAFYFKKPLRLDLCLELAQGYHSQVETLLGRKVVISYWGTKDDWVVIGHKIEVSEYGKNPEKLAGVIAHFMKVTYAPVTQIYRDLKG